MMKRILMRLLRYLIFAIISALTLFLTFLSTGYLSLAHISTLGFVAGLICWHWHIFPWFLSYSKGWQRHEQGISSTFNDGF
ncbi:MAG: hypothetical protein FWE34_07005 [Defluviitaleaceae bacterium]|nr:hypothetical protein [Defluviitaleaceae bacterium]